MNATRHKLTERLEVPHGGHELYIHVLAGRGIVRVGGQISRLGREASVFEPGGRGLYARGFDLSIEPGPEIDVIVASHPLDDDADGPMASFAYPKIHIIGSGPSRREVREILGVGGPAFKLRCGETVNSVGGWSSWPPHSFDKKPELRDQFEEKFFYFMNPKSGYGVQMKNGFPCVVRSGDEHSIALGEHPVVGAPDTQLAYVWFYVSPEDKVYGTWCEDVGTYK